MSPGSVGGGSLGSLGEGSLGSAGGAGAPGSVSPESLLSDGGGLI